MQVLGVVGAGPMGSGIAQIGLQAGMEVVLYDLDRASLERSAETLLGFIAKLEDKGKLEEGAAESARARLTLAAGIADFAPCDAVVEAIVERLEPKQQLFAELEDVVSFEDIDAVAPAALRHRLLLNFEGLAEGISTDEIIADLLGVVDKQPA